MKWTLNLDGAHVLRSDSSELLAAVWVRGKGRKGLETWVGMRYDAWCGGPNGDLYRGKPVGSFETLRDAKATLTEALAPTEIGAL